MMYLSAWVVWLILAVSLSFVRKVFSCCCQSSSSHKTVSDTGELLYILNKSSQYQIVEQTIVKCITTEVVKTVKIV